MSVFSCERGLEGGGSLPTPSIYSLNSPQQRIIICDQSRPQALWPAVSRQEKLWGYWNFITAGFLR